MRVCCYPRCFSVISPLAFIFCSYHVRLVKSEKPGVGKSLWVKRNLEKLMDGKNQRRQRGRDIIIPLHQKIDVDAIIERLYDDLKSNLDDGSSNSIHFDIAQKVTSDHHIFCTSGIDNHIFEQLTINQFVLHLNLELLSARHMEA